ncbi:MAG: hypothetical protein J5614_04700 [Paludibacteraceae bacterium]|nr:hypothetical protein [Paludibacteraceae bacterium]
MIKIEDLFAKTNGGLDIILSYYPQAGECLDSRKPFRMRNERTPSAYIKRFGEIWKVTDFGDDAHAMNAVDICMKEEGRNFREALCILADRFGVSETLSASVNRAVITTRPATADEKEGDFSYESRDRFSEKELEIWGPKVKQEHLDALSYIPLISYTKTSKDRETGALKTTTVASTETYPIFLRQCGEFVKIYQPLNPDKAFRFFYNGTKPKDFLNGLKELQTAYTQFNESQRITFEGDPLNEGRPYKVAKLQSACICSGERDAVNCLANGCYPLWLNSETAPFTENMYKDVMKCVETLYNIPDKDDTGIRRGRELAFKYIDIRTAFLPDWLSDYRDNRGRPRKDLRDYVELRSSKHDFEALLKTAMPVRFWETTMTENGSRLEVNTAYFIHFLSMSGFGRLEDTLSREEYLVKVDGTMVRKVTAKDIRQYVIAWLRERHEDVKVLNLILNSNRTKGTTMEDLPLLNLSFSTCESDRQFVYFKNLCVEVTADKFSEHKANDMDRYVWEDNISQVHYRRTAPAFDFRRESEDMWSICPTNIKSHYFRYLINASRIYWREELEQRATENAEENARYNEANKFNICGPRLNYEEQQEQMQNLAAKLFAIGYLLHRHKDQARAWALWIMEDKISNDGESSGGSGKSFMIKFLENIKKILFLGGKNKKLTENQFIFQNVTESTDIIWVDDADQHFDFTFFYDKITGSLETNKKHVDSNVMDFTKSPKFAFTSNFPPPNKDSATLRRLLFVVFSDYYHQKTDDNDYRESRRIYDDFNLELGGEHYTNEMWNDDVNFMLDCIQFYLKVSKEVVKITPPMDRIKDRISIQIMGNQFRQWAEVYFHKNSENVNTYISKNDTFNAFLRESNVKGWTTNKFSKAIREFCSQCDWVTELNPVELVNDNKGRIIRKNFMGKSEEFYYIRTENKPIKQYVVLTPQT